MRSMYWRDQLLGHLDLDAEHQLLALAARLDLLGRELRLRRHEAHVSGDRAVGLVVDGDPRLGADLHAGGLLRREEDLHVDVFQVHQRQRLSAGSEHLAGFGQAIEHSAADGRLERRIVDARLDRRRVRLRDLDLLLGGLQPRLRFGEGGLGRFELRLADVQLPLRAGVLRDELPGAFDLDLGELDLALLLDDGGLGDRQPLLRGGDARLGLGQFGLQRDGVQPHQHLARLDEVALVDEDLLDPSGSLADTSTSLASIRPLPEAMPSGSASCGSASTGSRRTRRRRRASTAMIQLESLFEIDFGMADSLVILGVPSRWFR